MLVCAEKPCCMHTHTHIHLCTSVFTRTLHLLVLTAKHPHKKRPHFKLVNALTHTQNTHPKTCTTHGNDKKWMKEKNTFKFYRQRLATNKLSLSDKTAAWWLLVCFAQNKCFAYHPPWSQTPESNNYKMVWLIPEAIIAIPKSSHAMEKFTTSINGTTLDMTQQQDIH